MMPRNFLSALLFFITVALFQVSVVSSHTQRKAASIKGFWRLSSATANGVVEEIPPGRTVKVTMNQESSTIYRVTVKVANTMTAIIEIVGTENVDGSYSIKVGGLASTRLRPPVNLLSMERFILTYFPILDNVNLVNGNLVVKGNPNVTVVLTK